MTRIAFTSDLHVDAYGSRIDPETGLNARLVDQLNALRSVSLASWNEKADALVVAGDFTERRHPAPWLVSQIRGSLSHGPERQVYVRGNHDGEIAGGSIITVLDDHESRTGITRPDVAAIGDGAICAIPYLDRHWLRAKLGFEHAAEDEIFGILSDQIVTLASGLYAQAKAAGAKWTVLVLHQTLAGAFMSDTQQAFLGDRGVVVDAGRLAAIGFEGVVAGHLHRHQSLDGLACPVLYPGSISRVDFGEQNDPKGFLIADVEPGRFDWKFVEIPSRRFVTLRGQCMHEISEVEGAIVRCIDVDPDIDVNHLRTVLESYAFEITEIRRKPAESAASAGAFSEALVPADALAAFFDADTDAEALVAEGRRILEAVAA